MQAHKPTFYPGVRGGIGQGLPLQQNGDPRERQASEAARPAVPQPRSERLAGPFRVKPGYLERRAWPFSAEA